MIEFIKNLFKKEQRSTDFWKNEYQVLLDELSIFKQKEEESQKIEVQTYKIFKATRLHPEISKEGQNVFFAECKTLLQNETLDRVLDEITGEFAESIIQTADTKKKLLELRYKMIGADEVRKRLQRYADSIEVNESFNPHDPI